MNKPGTVRQFTVCDKVDYFTKPTKGVKIIQSLTLRLIGGRKWLNTKNQQEITLSPTNIKNHYQAVGKNGVTYLLIIVC